MILPGSIFQNRQLIEGITALSFDYPIIFYAVFYEAFTSFWMGMTRTDLDKSIKGCAAVPAHVFLNFIPGVNIMWGRKFRCLVDSILVHDYIYTLFIQRNPSIMNAIRTCSLRV